MSLRRKLASWPCNSVKQRDVATASLEAEKERMQHLEGLAAQLVSRADALEHDLATARADLAKVIEMVRSSFAPSL